jgi:hypothetical protein
VETRAILSPDRKYRYALWRRWSDGPQVLFVMLNPSTADESIDDPTIRRCIAFAKAWGFGSLAVGNLFALRTPSPKVLRQSRAPVGETNDSWLKKLQASSTLSLAAWGNHGKFQNRGASVKHLLANVHTLGITKVGEPRHPLYVSAVTKPFAWG